MNPTNRPHLVPDVWAVSQLPGQPTVGALPDTVRNMALWLDGWDERSIWGYDPPARGFFAQLWRNGQPDESDDSPHIWISPRFSGDLATPDELARQIALRTHRKLAEVCDAMNESAPDHLKVHPG